MKIIAQSGTIQQLNDRHLAIVTLSGIGKKPDKHHTILILDCSGSMSESIDDVRRDSQAFLREMPAEEFVSAIIFSGHKSAELIAGPTELTKNGRDLMCRAIEKKVRILNTTVFSESLTLTIETVRKLAGPDTAHNAVLFTDGCAVPEKWSTEEEQRKTLALAREMGGTGVALSAIGYGVYYDVPFLTKLIETAGGNGTFRHVSEIDDFRAAVEQNHTAFRAQRSVNLDIAVNGDKGNGLAVYRTDPQVCRLSQNGTAKVGGIPGDTLTLYVELSKASKKLTLTGTADGKKINETITAETLTNAKATEFIRVLGAHAFLSGERETAAELLRLCGDDGLAEKAETSYSDREQREASNTFRGITSDGKQFIGKGLKPTGPNHNVLNILRALIEDENNIVSIPKGAYKRSGLLTKDPRVIDPPAGRTLRVMGYTSDESRFNFSMKTQKDVKVKPENGVGPNLDKKVWRTYNVVLDGNLHVPQLEAVLGKEATFTMLQEAGVVDKKEKYNATKTYTLDLRNVKLVSSAWANPSVLGFVGLLKKEKDLEVAQTALNALRKELGVPAASEDGDMYIEKSAKVEGVPQEFYQAPNIEIRLMDYKAPTFDAAKFKTYEAADKEVKKVRQTLVSTRFMIRAITFAMHATGAKSIKWDAGSTTKRGQYEKLEQLAEFDKAKLKRVTWTSTEVCS